MWIRARARASRSSARSRRSRARWAMSASTRIPAAVTRAIRHHVVGADLDPVERVRHGGARAGQVAPRGAGTRPCSVPNAPIHCGSDERAIERLELLQAPHGQLLVADAERELDLAQQPEDQQRAGGMGRRLVEVLARGRSNRRSRRTDPTRSAASSPRTRAPRAATAAIPSLTGLERFVGSAGQVEGFRQVRVRPLHAAEVVVLRGRSRSPGAGSRPLRRRRRARSGTSRAC